MIVLLLVVVALVPGGLYLWREHKMATPSLQWPALGKILGLTYEPAPPRMSGTYNGRRVAVESSPAGATLTAWLAAETALRVECGTKTAMTERAWIVIPDQVAPSEAAFRDKLIARCSAKAAGARVFDATLQRRLASLPHVDFVGEKTRVVWNLPALKTPDEAEAVLGALCAVADSLETFPLGGTPLA
jgi:hypothetical protein